MLTVNYVKVTISPQKHLSPGTGVLTAYKQRHISTSGLLRNAVKRAHLESTANFTQPIALPEVEIWRHGSIERLLLSADLRRWCDIFYI